MYFVVAAFVKEVRVFGEVLCTCQILSFSILVVMECITGVVRVCGGMNDDVAIE